MILQITQAQTGFTLAKLLRSHLAGKSWSEVRRLVETRHVRIDGELCLDAARRLKEGQAVEVLEQSLAKPRQQEAVVIRHLDAHVVVVEKPAGVCTVRHPSERHWPARRKALSPALEDMLPGMIADMEGKKRKGPPPRLRVVHRLDKETSGLVVFARTPQAERELGRQFKRHSVMRRYLAIVPGAVQPRKIETRLVRDRGDGRRGSTTLPGVGKNAITHIEVSERLPGYSLITCRLETGRTHQIRIHLAELGYPLCGEKVYNRPRGGKPKADKSGAPRLALHAAELGFLHPVTEETLYWAMELPRDLQALVGRLRKKETN
jgi:23S rRNA pseudouridine1911/1915/1917 synthase